MKKLLIAMTAAAVGTCAWADGDAGGDGQGTTPATPAMLSESFSTTWTPAAPWWSYTGDATAELAATNVPTKTDANNIALYLNTGSKVLSGNFGGIGADDKPVAVNIPNNNLYFKSTVIFNDPSDTLPELGQNDKFALVVLDNIDSVQDTEYDQATNLWVIAGHGVDGKRAYLLCPNVNTLELDAGWLSAPHEITVKAYNNVLTGSSAAGFLVMIGTDICTVKKSYKIVNGLIDYSTGTDVDYLGYTSAQVALSERYANKQLLISAASGATLTSVDFQGQGIIDDVSLATTGADFGPDVTAKTVTFTGYDSTGIVSISPNLVNGVYTIPNDTANGNIPFTVTLNTGYVLKVADNEKVTVSGSAPTYTVTYAYAGDNSCKIELDVFKPAAYVGGTAYKTFKEALEKVTVGGTIQLAGAITLESEPIQIESDVTIDLAGKTIEVAGDFPAIYNAASTLTIEDSVGGGKVKGAVTGDGTFVITGGGFLASANTADGKFTLEGSVADGYAVSGPTEDGYWVVAAGSSYTESEKLVEGAMTAEATETLDAIAAAIGESAGDDEVATYIANAYGTDEDGKPIKVTVDTLAGAVNVAVSVNNNLPLMTSENAEFVAEAVAADEGNVAAFEFTLQDGSADKVLPLTVKAKLENIIKVCTDLNTWVNAKIEAEGVADADVKATVSNGKVKVQLKSKTGGKCFMKLKAE